MCINANDVASEAPDRGAPVTGGAEGGEKWLDL